MVSNVQLRLRSKTSRQAVLCECRKGERCSRGGCCAFQTPFGCGGGGAGNWPACCSDIKHLPCKRQAAHAGAALAPDRFLVVGWVAVVRSQRVGRRQSNLSVHHGPGLSRFARGGGWLRPAGWRRSPRAADHEHVPSPRSAPPALTAPCSNPQTTAPAWSVVRA